MRAATIAFLLLGAATVYCQPNEIGQRLRHALGAGGNAERAVAALSAKNYDLVCELLTAEPGSGNAARGEILSLRGAVSFLRGDMAAAALDFDSAAKIAPLSDADSFTDAMALITLGRKTEARATLEKLVRSNPERPIYVYWLGKLDYDERRYEQAAEELDRALALDPNSARAWDSLGLVLDMQGHAGQAHDAFDKAVSLNRQQPHPSSWPPHNLGYWLLRADRPVEAEAALRESLRYDPEFAEAHYHLGRALEKEGRDGEAVTEYLSAVKLDSSAADACYSLAILYRKLNREAEATAMFSEYRKRRQIHP